jgi:ribosomal protein L11 methyltransferase
MPYRIDLRGAPDDALDRLVEMGALDVESIDDGGGIAAIMPDRVVPDSVAQALGLRLEHALGLALGGELGAGLTLGTGDSGSGEMRVTPARGRDDGSVWVLSPRPVQAGRLRIVPADWPPDPPEAGMLRMVDGPAFGTGLHPTTALCLEALDDELTAWRPQSVLDVGTGSGVLALAALCIGVPRVVALDIDAAAVRVAAENARLNGLASRLYLVHGGPEALSGSWPLVLANVLAAPLMEMSFTLARRVGRGGRLVLSGIRSSLAADVEQAYRRVGIKQVRTQARDGWTALTFHASW